MAMKSPCPVGKGSTLLTQFRSEMRCPICGSENVECTSDTRRHVHECFDCGAKDIYREPRP